MDVFFDLPVFLLVKESIFSFVGIGLIYVIYTVCFNERLLAVGGTCTYLTVTIYSDCLAWNWKPR